MSTLLVTGASGTLGRSFLSATKDTPHETLALVRQPRAQIDALADSVIQGDVRTLTSANIPNPVDAIVNFATGTEGSANDMTTSAVEAVTNMLVIARQAEVPKLIHISSMSVHSGPVRRRSSEPGDYELEHRPELRGAYALSKTRAEKALIAATSRDQVAVAIVRPGLVFSREMTDPLAGIAVGLPLGLVVGLGRATQGVPWIDIDDLNTALIKLVEMPSVAGELSFYDLLSGTPSKRDLLAAYRRHTGQPLREIWLPLAVPLAAAVVLDLLRPGMTRASYSIRRLYRFEPRDIDHYDAWKRLHGAPEAQLASSVSRSITAHPALDLTADEALRTRAASHLRVVDGPTPNTCRRVLLIGAGRIAAEMHAPVLSCLSSVQLTAVIEPRLDPSSRFAWISPGVERFGSLGTVPDELLNDAVAVIATPGATHVDLASTALRRGASILLEKPAALSLDEFSRLRAEEHAAGEPVTVLHNYRLRPPALALWRFICMHDVGPVVRLRVRFASPPIRLERARWVQDERRNRSLLYELAIHVLDLAFVVGGRLIKLDTPRVRLSLDERQTITVAGSGTLAGCEDAYFDLDLSGTAPCVQLYVEFARSACVLDFYPDAFRVLPRKPNPINDASAALRRLGFALRQRTRRGYSMSRARPHEFIYREHLRRLAGEAKASPFGLDSIDATMSSIGMLAAAVYDEVGTQP